MASVKGKTPYYQTQPCPKHPNQSVQQACETCKVLVCQTCRLRHSDHDIKPCEGDDQLVQSVCRAREHELNNIRDQLDYQRYAKLKHDFALEEAKSLVKDEIERIIAKAREIQKSVDSQLEMACDRVMAGDSKMCDNIKLVEGRVSNLTDVRNSKNTYVLIPEAVNSAVMVEQFGYLKYIDKDENKVPNLGEILPGIHKLDAVLDDMESAFEVQTGDVAQPFGYESVGVLEPTDIPDQTNDAYRICESEDSDTVTMHGNATHDMYKYHVKSATFDRQDAKCDIYNCIKVAQDTYAALDDRDIMYILDDNGILYSENMSEYFNWDLCYHSPYTFISLGNDILSPYMVTLRRINISTGRFVVEQELKIPLIEHPYFICTHQDKNIVSLASDSHLYIVNMQTEDVKIHDISGYVDKVFSIYVDDNDNTLVGDSKGCIHYFDKDMKHAIVAEVEEGEAWGITIRNGKLIVTAGGKLWKQK